MERRLAAILAADVVGYSRLMAADEKGMHVRFKALRQGFIELTIAEHRGRVVKLKGDGALVEFASVVDAIECAAAIQKGIAERQADVPEDQRIAFRIGINIGDIIIEDDDIYGDGVNIAARLEQLAEPGGICVSQTVHDHVRDKVDLALEAAGEHRVKNIPNPVSVYRVVLERADANRRPSGTERPQAGLRAAIAVLPFENLAGDDRWDRFAAGVCEDIITDLARHADLSVIARSSTLGFKNRSLDVRRIGRELGVRYVLEGSIQAGSGRIRVTAQLIDAETGAHVWAERYDREEIDLLLVQDDIVQQVAGALVGWEGRISRAARRRARHASPSSLAAYERYLLAYEAEAKMTRIDTERAIELADSALALDPTLARAWLVRAYAWNHASLFGWVEDAEAATQACRESVLRAYELDPSDGTIMMEVGDLRAEDGDLAGARAAYEEAARLAANHGDTLALLAKYFVGTFARPEQARAMMERAFRLNPGAPPLYFYNQIRVAYLCGDCETAVAAARRSPDTALTKLFLAMSLAELGRDSESEAVVKKLRSESPEFNPAAVCAAPWLLDPGAQARVRNGLQRLGLDARGT
ncbi:MAG: adenylate/guanylate cyclase domain-containing protein [Geminicoccaceae bacterium]